MKPLLGARTGVPLTKRNKLKILKKARALIAEHWTKGTVRKKHYDRKGNMVASYCVLGACEQAAYELQLTTPDTKSAFRTAPSRGFAYALGEDLGLYEYSHEKYGGEPWQVNDWYGQEKAVEMLDGYISQLEEKTPGE